MNIFDTLRARWSGKFPDLNSEFETVGSFAGVAAHRKGEIAAPGRLSPAGVADELRAWLSGGVVRELRRVQKSVADGKEALAQQREKLKRPVFDPSDAIGAAHRKEAREYLRSLDRAERLKLLSPDADPLLVAAALELPALSGLDKGALEHLQAAYAERNHGDALALIEERDEAFSALEAAVTVVKEEVRQAVELPADSRFQAWFEGA